MYQSQKWSTSRQILLCREQNRPGKLFFAKSFLCENHIEAFSSGLICFASHFMVKKKAIETIAFFQMFLLVLALLN